MQEAPAPRDGLQQPTQCMAKVPEATNLAGLEVSPPRSPSPSSVLPASADLRPSLTQSQCFELNSPEDFPPLQRPSSVEQRVGQEVPTLKVAAGEHARKRRVYPAASRFSARLAAKDDVDVDSLNKAMRLAKLRNLESSTGYFSSNTLVPYLVPTASDGGQGVYGIWVQPYGDGSTGVLQPIWVARLA
ncbi:hypothetical protein BRADI_5g01934v3 [Brachypodium distachyon]|uniref:Uncharacterized protein n=2 Tax=Brachypodium distachyon TaxID=15368 RepID=A0A2K2CEZ1_BRADI|nr:hypothetical protein BRADI_5g01934v3 [Brachypodium distachyon]